MTDEQMQLRCRGGASVFFTIDQRLRISDVDAAIEVSADGLTHVESLLSSDDVPDMNGPFRAQSMTPAAAATLGKGVSASSAASGAVSGGARTVVDKGQLYVQKASNALSVVNILFGPGPHSVSATCGMSAAKLRDAGIKLMKW